MRSRPFSVYYSHLTCVAIALALAAILGLIGAWYTHLDESRHGASYSEYEYEYFRLVALPGILVTSALCPYDLRIDELWRKRDSVILWNTVVLGGPLWAILFFLREAFRRPTSRPNSGTDPKTTKDEQSGGGRR